MHLLPDIFQICSEELAVINIRTVPRKSHILLNETDRLRLPDNLNPEIQIHTDGISLLATAIGSDDFIEEFLDQKLQNIATLLRKMDKIQSLQSKYQMLKLSINSKLRHLLRSLSTTRPQVLAFCQTFDQMIMQFFSQSFHI